MESGMSCVPGVECVPNYARISATQSKMCSQQIFIALSPDVR